MSKISRINYCKNWFEIEQSIAIKNQHRFCLILCGDEQWALAELKLLFTDSTTCGIWIGQQSIFKSDQCLTFKQSKQLLGQETSRLIYNAHQGFDLDTLGRSTGCLRAGGCFILLLPLDFNTWNDPAIEQFLSFSSQKKSMTNHYLDYFKFILKQQKINMIRQDQAFTHLLTSPLQSPQKPVIQAPFKTLEQQQAVIQIYKTATGRANRPFILTAARGRGKTAALGLAIAQLLANTTKNIIISAPQKSAVLICFQYFKMDQKRVQFIAPDQLTRDKPPTDILIVDEAAAIPLSLLKNWLTTYQRVIFSTTIAGYEGSGSGFNLRFKDFLKKHYKNYKEQHIKAPIRWAIHDPLEHLIYKALLIGSENIKISNLDDLKYIKINRQQLSQDPISLAAFFSLLRNAHYRTSPNNLRQFLDAPDISLYGIKNQENSWIGCAVCLDEGGLPLDLVDQIIKGRRRLKGHLIAQNLSYYHLQADLGAASYRRINRIAILPALQNQGLGQKLVKFIDQQRQQDQIQFLACSFGATPRLIHFWRGLDFIPVHLSHTLETSSMRHALIMLKGKKSLLSPLQTQMQKQFILQMPFTFKLLNSLIVRDLLLNNPFQDNQQTLSVVQLFALDYRTLAISIDDLSLFVLSHLKKSSVVWTVDEQQLLIEQILQRHLPKKSALSGKKMQLKILRILIAKALA